MSLENTDKILSIESMIWDNVRAFVNSRSYNVRPYDRKYETDKTKTLVWDLGNHTLSLRFDGSYIVHYCFSKFDGNTVLNGSCDFLELENIPGFMLDAEIILKRKFALAGCLAYIRRIFRK